MKAKTISFGILKAIGILLGGVLLVWLLFKIKALILYIGIAAFIALLCRPMVLFLQDNLKFHRTLASLTTLLVVMMAIVGLLYVFVPIIVQQSKNISEIDFRMVKKDLNELNIQASDYLGVQQLDIVEAIKDTSYVQNFNLEIIPSFIDIFFGNVGAFVIGLLSVLFISFFLLKDDEIVTNAVTVFAKPGKEIRFLRVLDKVKELLSRYFMGLLLQIMILTLFYTVLLLYLDISNSLAIAIICAFLNIVPYLGPLLGSVVMMLVVISNNLGADFSSELLPLLVITLIGYSIAQLFDNLICQPVIFGKSVRSHPLEIFLIILMGGFVFGIAGMILAVPVYTTLKVISKEFLSEYKIVKHLTKNL
ncbi:AI-2E family transporter [Altibacter sp. HG106]|uniref:AI-2E family transporter n=1 Tax=Altibacter sp. HG106 TaxID=3023937 RepID=UPI002350FFE4|nr:AI-2E family transporter [Altibacter sp. HG106]MDC7993478.1 AI-2E family transporter [Altibacter sp. HG106]